MNDKKPSFVSGLLSDPQGFQEIYTRFWKPILSYLSARVDDIETAEDIAQEVFLKAYRFRGSYNPQFAISTWLWSIAKNTLIDWFRREELSEHIELPGVSVDYERVACPDHNAEKRLMEGRGREVLLRMISELSELQRKALSLRIVEHWPYRQIAKHLNMSLSAAKCLVHRAKGNLIRQRVEERSKAVFFSPEYQ